MRPTEPATEPPLADLLAGAAAAISDPEAAGRAMRAALAERPEDPEARLAAYRFHFYRHDYGAALEQAHWLIAHAARRLNIATDWLAVSPDDAPFTEHAFAPGLYLQALIAAGYCAARLGEEALARDTLGKAAALDPSDRFGGAHLLRVVLARADEDDD
ncbi:MAG: hypothetical protein AAF675_12790 [Pseudomonadota bacterium]